MNSLQVKENLHQLIDSISDDNDLLAVETLVSSQLNRELPPMTISEYEARIRESEDAISRGDVISQEDLESESENW